jgi:hypothetical protein
MTSYTVINMTTSHAYCVMWNQHLQRRRQAMSVSVPRNERPRVAIILGRAHTATNAKATAIRFVPPRLLYVVQRYQCFGETCYLPSETWVLIHRSVPRHVSVDKFRVLEIPGSCLRLQTILGVRVIFPCLCWDSRHASCWATLSFRIFPVLYSVIGLPYFPVDNARVIYTKTFSKLKKNDGARYTINAR